MKKLITAVALMLGISAQAQHTDTPLMGWSSWNTFGIQISDKLIMEQADAMVKTGLKDAGYLYINTDDGYFGGRDEQGNLLIHPQRFPGGMKPVVDHIHDLGLLAGIYSDAGFNTCASMFGGDTIGIGVGLCGHDQQDADLFFKKLDFDFIKIDFCGGSPYHNRDRLRLSERERYTDIAAAIANTGKKGVRVNACRWAYPGTWVGNVCGSWRTTGDINCSWRSVRGILQENLYLADFSTRGHFNDMDMLEVGRGLSIEEDKTHFGMWCIMNSPLLIGCDMRNIKPEALELMKNKELIALNQDRTYQQAYVVKKTSGCWVLARDVEKIQGKRRAVAIYNPTDEAQVVTFDLSEVEMGGKVTARDLFEHVDATNQVIVGSQMKVRVPAHATRIYKLAGSKRLERSLYEAETAYNASYQELTNNQQDKTGVYDVADHCSGGYKAAWLGMNEKNALQFRHVWSQQGGSYQLTIAYLTEDARQFQVRVNGGEEQTVSVPAGNIGEVREVTINVQLHKGENQIVLHNNKTWMPDIDYIKLVK